MKSRDIIGIVIAIVLVTVSATLLYSVLAPAPADSGIQATIPQPVKVPLAESADMNKLTDLRKLTDFSVPQRCIDQPALCDRNGQSPI